MNTLYELTGEYMQLLQMAEDPETDAEALEGTMDAIGGMIEDKADGYAKVVKQLDAESAMLKTEIERMTLRLRTLDNNKKRVLGGLENAMRATGKTKFKTLLFSFAIAKTPAKVVVDCDISEVPPKFIRYPEPEIDKAKIKEELKNGEELEFAHLEQGETLRIR